MARNPQEIWFSEKVRRAGFADAQAFAAHFNLKPYRLEQIYQAIKELDVPAPRVLAVSIPDFSPLPGAAPFGSPSELRARIDAFNDIAEKEAASRPFRFADITSISREANRGDGWLAGDGLHPGPAQHQAFADHIWEKVAPSWRMVVLQRFSPSAQRVVELAFDEALLDPIARRSRPICALQSSLSSVVTRMPRPGTNSTSLDCKRRASKKNKIITTRLLVRPIRDW